MRISGFTNRLSLPVKMAISMLLVVSFTMFFVQLLESRRLKDIFIRYQLAVHEKNAQEQLDRFVDLLKGQKNLVKALVTQKNFLDHLALHEKNGWGNSGNILYYNSPPEWFPSITVTRAFYSNAYALLFDSAGQVREVYQGTEKSLNSDIGAFRLMLRRLMTSDGVITYMDKEPCQAVIERIYTPSHGLRATLLFIFPIDAYLIRRSQGAILGDNDIALLDKDNLVMASSNPDIITVGMSGDLLASRYYMSKKTFFSYGETEIEMMFVSLIPKTTIDSLTGKVLAVQLGQGLIYAAAFILSSTLVVFLLSGRIKGLTGETVDFIKRNLGRQYSTPPAGDEMATLELSFRHMKEEIASYQERLAEEKERLFNAKKLESIAILAAGIAHEINNPLTNASLNLQVLKDRLAGGNATGDVMHKISSVERNIDRASTIARELLKFSRPGESEFIRVDIADVIRSALILVGYKLERIRILQNLSTVPEIYGDPLKLEQVFINVLTNSLEAMPGGGDITISVSCDNGYVRTEIADTGVGIREESIPKVFDPFFTTKEVGLGTGLGLAISYGIINQHNGVMELSSKPGQGTTVTLKLPATEGT